MNYFTTHVRYFLNLPVILLFTLLGSCSESPKLPELVLPETNLESEALIPKPVEVVNARGAFPLDLNGAIYAGQGTDPFSGVGAYLSDEITKATDLALPLS